MSLTWLAAGLLAVAAPSLDVPAPTRGHPIGAESRLWITGASNIRRFTCTARRVAGALELRGEATRTATLSGNNVSLQPSLSVSVDQIDCGIGRMNRHFRDALRGAQHPVIEFRLSRYEVDLTALAPVARIAGLVTIAGVQRPVVVTAAVRDDTLGMLHVRGSYVVRPTEFGITPPRRFGGLLRVRDRIVVHFDVALDSDGGAIDEIACALIQPDELQMELNHAPK